jgi:hypothetical protein
LGPKAGKRLYIIWHRYIISYAMYGGIKQLIGIMALSLVKYPIMANSKFKFQISKTVHNNTLASEESSKCEPKWRSTMYNGERETPWKQQWRMNDPLTIMLQIWSQLKSISIVVSMVSLSLHCCFHGVSFSIVVSMVSLSLDSIVGKTNPRR